MDIRNTHANGRAARDKDVFVLRVAIRRASGKTRANALVHSQGLLDNGCHVRDLLQLAPSRLLRGVGEQGGKLDSKPGKLCGVVNKMEEEGGDGAAGGIAASSNNCEYLFGKSEGGFLRGRKVRFQEGADDTVARLSIVRPFVADPNDLLARDLEN